MERSGRMSIVAVRRVLVGFGWSIEGERRSWDIFGEDLSRWFCLGNCISIHCVILKHQLVILRRVLKTRVTKEVESHELSDLCTSSLASHPRANWQKKRHVEGRSIRNEKR